MALSVVIVSKTNIVAGCFHYYPFKFFFCKYYPRQNWRPVQGILYEGKIRPESPEWHINDLL